MAVTTHFAFTICSNNYLGQALALKNSFLRHNPDFGFFIVLVDTLSDEVDYSLSNPADILPVAEIEGIDIDDLISRYYIIELNTSVKPSVFKHIIKNNPRAEAIYYLDPDLYFYNSLAETNKLLRSNTAVLTPHILTSIPRDGMQPEENTFLRFGIYNLGFLGVNVLSEAATNMLDWWEERTLKFGYDRPNKGYFVDQLWMAQAPIFFKDVVILKSYNYNMAPWNLHERSIISIDGDKILLNDNTYLIFYHFSKLADDGVSISREYDRYGFTDFPLLKTLYDDYRDSIEKSNYSDYKKIPIGYEVQVMGSPKIIQGSLPKRFLKRISRMINSLANKV